MTWRWRRHMFDTKVLRFKNYKHSEGANLRQGRPFSTYSSSVVYTVLNCILTSCKRAAATICPAPLLSSWAPKRLVPPCRRQLSSSFPLQPPDAPIRRWAKRPGDLDLWPFDLESGVRVTCDVGYLCANFGLPRPLCSRLRPDVLDRRHQTADRRQTSDSIIASCPRLRGEA